jgi:hypothetical protein
VSNLNCDRHHREVGKVPQAKFCEKNNNFKFFMHNKPILASAVPSDTYRREPDAEKLFFM